MAKTTPRKRSSTKTPVFPSKAKNLDRQLSSQLRSWYLQNKRELPWRQSRDPYRIWISEVMLQQTTTQAVIPYYQRFLQRFPTVKSLADASEKDVLAQWAGLGYYSRARNLHKAAKILATTGFPKTAEELLELPGFGPYTSRAVSSLAFGENVGVLDGNVIRILSRVLGKKYEWWQNKDRAHLQTFADELAQHGDSSEINQGMMELGATICTPQSPSCFLCPWNKNCEARARGLQTELPLRKPKTASIYLMWSVEWTMKGQKVAFLKTHDAPFLKKSPLLPGSFQRLNQRPEKFDLKHTITKYEIFMQIKKSPLKSTGLSQPKNLLWLDVSKITEEIPYSLIHKVVQRALDQKS